ncbi:uncharacterized protein LOC143557627 [Bidens hawaiensis]|uniref:uncharacterized protein LOC143557627 n=1 Tax=Bidens hawaiensis TaxID=980011 RepID=UPI0040495C46
MVDSVLVHFGFQILLCWQNGGGDLKESEIDCAEGWFGQYIIHRGTAKVFRRNFRFQDHGNRLRERHKGCNVASRLVIMDGVICSTWSWVRAPRLGLEIEELRQLLLLCQEVVLVAGSDSVSWVLDNTRAYSTSTLKEKIREVCYVNPNYKFVWNNWVPGKVGILAWRAELDRVPVRALLVKRGIMVGEVDCPACGESDETTEHVFISYGLAQVVRQAITLWCKVPQISAFNIRDVLDLYKYTKFPKRKVKFFHVVCLASLWFLWKARNEMLFNSHAGTVERVVGDIKALSFLWVKSRSGSVSLSWKGWSGFNV